jgi:hypothetical protein
LWVGLGCSATVDGKEYGRKKNLTFSSLNTERYRIEIE